MISSALPVVWHYTIRDFFAGIVRDRAIRPAAAFAGGQARAAVWFSTNQDWEPSAAKNLTCADGSARLLQRDELHTIGITPIRIGVAPSVAPHTWHDFKRDGDLPAKIAGNIVSLAARVNSKPSWWYATFDAVPREQWLAVEHFDGWQWRPMPDGMW
ncbi:MAG TPA: hypothetical protein VHC22_01480 [Pirellulales bacterium]|nr:hypothetical protein [Pirellulales bacterium]